MTFWLKYANITTELNIRGDSKNASIWGAIFIYENQKQKTKFICPTDSASLSFDPDCHGFGWTIKVSVNYSYQGAGNRFRANPINH